jgi:hypothetical protein
VAAAATAVEATAAVKAVAAVATEQETVVLTGFEIHQPRVSLISTLPGIRKRFPKRSGRRTAA